MIFPIIRTDSIVQVGDKIRIDASASFISPDESAITLLEIEAEDSDGFLDVTAERSMDWIYSTSGDKVVTLRITTDGSPVTKTFTVSALSGVEDRLFSNDKDLIGHEADIYTLLPKGYSSFNHVHRSAQSIIIDSFTQRGIYKSAGVPINKENIFNIEEVRQWSKFLVLSMILMNASNEVSDYFSQKAQMYKSLAEKSATRALITFDIDEDGIADGEISLTVGRLVRR